MLADHHDDYHHHPEPLVGVSVLGSSDHHHPSHHTAHHHHPHDDSLVGANLLGVGADVGKKRTERSRGTRGATHDTGRSSFRPPRQHRTADVLGLSSAGGQHRSEPLVAGSLLGVSAAVGQHRSEPLAAGSLLGVSAAVGHHRTEPLAAGSLLGVSAAVGDNRSGEHRMDSQDGPVFFGGSLFGHSAGLGNAPHPAALGGITVLGVSANLGAERCVEPSAPTNADADWRYGNENLNAGTSYDLDPDVRRRKERERLSLLESRYTSLGPVRATAANTDAERKYEDTGERESKHEESVSGDARDVFDTGSDDPLAGSGAGNLDDATRDRLMEILDDAHSNDCRVSLSETDLRHLAQALDKGPTYVRAAARRRRLARMRRARQELAYGYPLESLSTRTKWRLFYGHQAGPPRMLEPPTRPCYSDLRIV